ncbi:MAG: ClpXP protease specificity-enhancing factor SspB [Tistlia sp.]|uniref:SspB family protein n=1 Tax=Tistlia sp. TaxID=3057121 RepID=UPI0034A2693D
MTDDPYRYDLMVEKALRTVVREALGVTAEHGLTGDHHFYLTFRTDWEAVEVSEALKRRYPREMTVVLQNRFWDLKVAEDHFSVVLTFNEVAETLVVPYEAISTFADPSVRFGLQFASSSLDEGSLEQGGPDEILDGEAAEDEALDLAGPPDREPPESAGEKVVTLDRFRNKT